MTPPVARSGGRPPSSSAPALEPGPFVLRSLLESVPLSADGGGTDTATDVRINCVEYYDGNLYVGTSAAELLHFVQIPPDPADPDDDHGSFILASRLAPPFTEPTNPPPGPARPGVQQIVLLPPVGKACVLCNWTATFYSLPELSPVFREVKNCNWIGGVDLQEDAATADRPRVTILLSLHRRLQVVRIGDEAARAVKNIEFAASILSARHDAIACVADARSYALVHVEHQLKIPLMTISSLDQPQPGAAVGQVQDLQASSAGSGDVGGLSRSSSLATPTATHAHARSGSATLAVPTPHSAQHSRSTSLGSSSILSNRSSVASPPPPPPPKGEQTAESFASAAADTQPTTDDTSTAPEGQRVRPVSADMTPRTTSTPPPPPPPKKQQQQQTMGRLKPHIASPTPEEFLLVTGTGPADPGIGMFVNLDGDPTRPTIEFARYPSSVVVDGGRSRSTSTNEGEGDVENAEEDGYVLAAMARRDDSRDKGARKHGSRSSSNSRNSSKSKHSRRSSSSSGGSGGSGTDKAVHYGLEIQRWDVNMGEDEPVKYWLEPPVSSPESEKDVPVGVASLLGSHEAVVRDMVDRLAQQRFALPAAAPATTETTETVPETAADADDDEDAGRLRAEVIFATRLAKTTGRLAVWSGDRIWWAMRNPLVLQLEAGLGLGLTTTDEGKDSFVTAMTAEARRRVLSVLGAVRGREARTELEFVTCSYVQQRAGVLLFMGLLDLEDHQDQDQDPSRQGDAFAEAEITALTDVLLDGALDPRVVLALVPGVREEVVQSRKGIWLFGGIRGVVEGYLGARPSRDDDRALSSCSPPLLQFLRRFLLAWRKKKGFGSVADEADVFRTVDAALLAVLLELDRATPRGLVAVRAGTVRADLYAVVDRGVACFERAVALLEGHHRLFVLSRLHQSRKQAGAVLATWRRIVEGARDDGGELAPATGEQRIREYLAKISSRALVTEYALWLARRNPRLAVAVLADRSARVAGGPFAPAEVLPLLRQHAPDSGAVEAYLAYLVFEREEDGDDNDRAAHVGELIAHYVDTVTRALRASPEKRAAMAASYEAYRALRPPKPTFHQFLVDNAPPGDAVWQSRLRLLELLGGPYAYDVGAIRTRLGEALDTGDDTADDAEHLLVPETILLHSREHQHEDALRLLVHGLGDYDTAVQYCLRGGASLYGVVGGAEDAGGRSQKVGAPRRDSLPTPAVQARLFRSLLVAFLALDDVSERVAQTGALLRRFAGYFDVADVLALLPDGWAVEVAAGFLVHALRELVRERHESLVARSLSGAENLRVHDAAIAAVEARGGRLETGEGGGGGGGGGEGGDLVQSVET